MNCFPLDYSNNPRDKESGYIFTEEDTILGDFGDHILVSCALNDEDYIIHYDYIDAKKVLRKEAHMVK
jgi:hypothetical protein